MTIMGTTMLSSSRGTNGLKEVLLTLELHTIILLPARTGKSHLVVMMYTSIMYINMYKYLTEPMAQAILGQVSEKKRMTGDRVLDG